MFKSEAKLFLSANNNLNYAKTIINECKRLVNEIESQENSDYIKCKNNIINCDIDALANKVETTKESLMKLDQSFASEYMALLQEYLQAASIDTSNMTDEEKMQYSIQMNAYARDYNYSLLYMLEKYEESDMLTPELQAQLEIQRTIVEQYDVQDKMAALTTTSQEYIDLFKTNAEYDKKLINLNPNLTDEEKSSYLKEYENSFNSTLEILELNRDVAKKTDELKNLEQGSEAYYKKENEIRQLQINYYEGKENLTEQEKKQLDFLKDGVELNELYIDKEQNNGFWHPFVEGEYDEAILDKKIEMGIATEDEIAYDKMNGWERAWENTKTFSTSVVFGIGSVTETVVDGVVMLAGEAGSCFGADTQWAEDFVSIHYADDAYTGLVQSDCINSVSAYSGWHTAGNMIGTTVGYVALSYLPGGPIVTGLAGGFSAMGSSSQRALDSGATFHEAFGTGAISFGAGFASGWAVGKLGALAQGSTSLMQVGGYTLAGMGVSTLEPIVNSVAEYAIYANEMIDENGNKVYDNIWDYYVDGGGLTNTVMAGVSGGISVGSKGIGGYNNYKKVYNNINNMENLDAESIQELQKRFKQMSSEQVYSVVQNSDNEYFKSNLKTYDLINSKNAAEFIVFGGYNSEYKTANFNLDWPNHAGYDPDTITSLKTLIDSSPDGKIEVSRVGGDGGHAIGTDWDSTSSQRSIPSSSSNGTAGIFDGNKYIDAIDVCSGAGDDISKVGQLVNLGYDETVAEAMVREFNSFDSLPEISGKGGLNEVLSPSQQSKYGYAGKAAAWETPSVKMEGGAGQMNSIFSWGTLKEAGIVTDIRNVTF